MIRATIFTSLVIAAVCSGCATPETTDPGKYAQLQFEPQPKIRNIELTGSRIRMQIDLNNPRPVMLSPIDVVYGGDVKTLPWVN